MILSIHPTYIYPTYTPTYTYPTYIHSTYTISLTHIPCLHPAYILLTYTLLTYIPLTSSHPHTPYIYSLNCIHPHIILLTWSHPYHPLHMILSILFHTIPLTSSPSHHPPHLTALLAPLIYPALLSLSFRLHHHISHIITLPVLLSKYSCLPPPHPLSFATLPLCFVTLLTSPAYILLSLYHTSYIIHITPSHLSHPTYIIFFTLPCSHSLYISPASHAPHIITPPILPSLYPCPQSCCLIAHFYYPPPHDCPAYKTFPFTQFPSCSPPTCNPPPTWSLLYIPCCPFFIIILTHFIPSFTCLHILAPISSIHGYAFIYLHLLILLLLTYTPLIYTPSCISFAHVPIHISCYKHPCPHKHPHPLTYMLASCSCSSICPLTPLPHKSYLFNSVPSNCQKSTFCTCRHM